MNRYYQSFKTRYVYIYILVKGLPGGSTVKNPPAVQEAQELWGLIPGSGRSPGGGHANPFQYSCLENHTDRRAWKAAVHRVTEESDMTEVT